jgi:hypothetical protein
MTTLYPDLPHCLPPSSVINLGPSSRLPHPDYVTSRGRDSAHTQHRDNDPYAPLIPGLSSYKNDIKPEKVQKNSPKMAGVESDIEIEGGAASRQLVWVVLHDKDNDEEVELLAENRWVSHGAIA